MTGLLMLPRPPEATAAMAAIPRSQIAPVMLGTQQGPDGHLGPEKAGAILILQATFTDPEGSAAFWKALVPLFELLESAPGFIRRYGFADGPHNTLIAFWRTAQDAGLRRPAPAPRLRAGPLPAALAVQPLRGDLGDDFQPRPGDLLPPQPGRHASGRPGGTAGAAPGRSTYIGRSRTQAQFWGMRGRVRAVMRSTDCTSGTPGTLHHT